MVLESTYNMSGETGSFGAVLAFNSTPTFQDLFDGIPQYYAGSMIQVQEVLTIYTDIVDQGLVDTDLTWFAPKRYLGTYQILSGGVQPKHFDGDDGYLVDTIQSIRRYSWYTITANPQVEIADYEALNLKNCNFALQPTVFVDPTTQDPIYGAMGLRNYEGETPVFRGRSSISPAPLADTDFFRQIEGVGLHLRPGVEGVEVEYKARIINDIYTAYNPFPVSVCNTAPVSCIDQYNAFIQDNRTTAFSSEAALRQVYPDVPFVIQQFPCEEGPDIPYWVPALT
jgi:hypothetical protein